MHAPLIGFLVLTSLVSFGQETKRVVVETATPPVREEYDVLKEHPEIKQGWYSRQFSIINLVEEISSVTFSALISKFSVFALIEKEPDDKMVSQGQIKLLNNDSVLFTFDIQYDFDNKARTRNIVKFNGLAIPTPGKFVVQLFANEAMISSKEVACNLMASLQHTATSS